VSRIAFGVPLNGEIGYLDSDTLSHAFQARKEI
jgi:Recombinational DNA repair protein (RecF pathway)